MLEAGAGGWCWRLVGSWDSWFGGVGRAAGVVGRLFVDSKLERTQHLVALRGEGHTLLPSLHIGNHGHEMVQTDVAGHLAIPLAAHATTSVAIDATQSGNCTDRGAPRPPCLGERARRPSTRLGDGSLPVPSLLQLPLQIFVESGGPRPPPPPPPPLPLAVSAASASVALRSVELVVAQYLLTPSKVVTRVPCTPLRRAFSMAMAMAAHPAAATIFLFLLVPPPIALPMPTILLLAVPVVAVPIVAVPVVAVPVVAVLIVAVPVVAILALLGPPAVVIAPRSRP